MKTRLRAKTGWQPEAERKMLTNLSSCRLLALSARASLYRSSLHFWYYYGSPLSTLPSPSRRTCAHWQHHLFCYIRGYPGMSDRDREGPTPYGIIPVTRNLSRLYKPHSLSCLHNCWYALPLSSAPRIDGVLGPVKPSHSKWQPFTE